MRGTPSHVVRPTAAIAFDGGEGRGVQAATRRSYTGSEAAGAGRAVASNMPKAATGLTGRD